MVSVVGGEKGRKSGEKSRLVVKSGQKGEKSLKKVSKNMKIVSQNMIIAPDNGKMVPANSRMGSEKTKTGLTKTKIGPKIAKIGPNNANTGPTNAKIEPKNAKIAQKAPSEAENSDQEIQPKGTAYWGKKSGDFYAEEEIEESDEEEIENLKDRLLEDAHDQKSHRELEELAAKEFHQAQAKMISSDYFASQESFALLTQTPHTDLAQTESLEAVVDRLKIAAAAGGELAVGVEGKWRNSGDVNMFSENAIDSVQFADMRKICDLAGVLDSVSGKYHQKNYEKNDEKNDEKNEKNDEKNEKNDEKNGFTKIQITPELKPLLQDIKNSFQSLDLNSTLLKTPHLLTPHGLSYLDMKNRVLLHYLVYLNYYVFLKLHDRVTPSHSVFERLVELRTLIERLKPIDASLAYSLSSSLRGVAVSKPNIASFVQDDEEENEDEENYRQNDNKKKIQKNIPKKIPKEDDSEEDSQLDTTNTNKLYKPKNLVAVEQTDAKSRAEKKLQRETEIQKARMLKQSLEALAHDPDAPIEEGKSWARRSEEEKMIKNSEARQAYEEENMLRLPKTKNIKKREKRRDVEGDIGATLEELGEFAEEVMTAKDQRRQEGILNNFLNAQNQLSQLKNIQPSIPRPRAAIPRQNIMLDDMEDDALGVTNDFVEATKPKKWIDPKILQKNDPDKFVDTSSKRGINRAIEKNRGLMRKRPKSSGTARVANRRKLTQRLKKVPKVAGAFAASGGSYAGESKGLKAHVTRSLKFKT